MYVYFTLIRVGMYVYIYIYNAGAACDIRDAYGNTAAI